MGYGRLRTKGGRLVFTTSYSSSNMEGWVLLTDNRNIMTSLSLRIRLVLIIAATQVPRRDHIRSTTPSNGHKIRNLTHWHHYHQPGTAWNIHHFHHLPLSLFPLPPSPFPLHHPSLASCPIRQTKGTYPSPTIHPRGPGFITSKLRPLTNNITLQEKS